MEKRIAIIITGMFRSFSKYLWPFIEKLTNNFDIYISIPNENIDDNYLNEKIKIDNYINNKKIKIFNITNDEPIINISDLTQREKNIIYQWHRIQKIYNEIKSDYDIIIRCRPDIQFNCDIEYFINMLNTLEIKQALFIPNGFNIYDHKVLENYNKNDLINDQIAIGSSENMKIYCNFYNNIISPFINKNLNRMEFIKNIYNDNYHELISEKMLYKYLNDNNIPIKRIDIPYRLMLSECFAISICGDSGSGKSTLSHLLKKILPFDKSLLLETDRYHKWERGSSNYNEYTHLHPEANNLEKMSEDAYKLKIGDNIYTVDYDHSTGKFTDVEKIDTAPYLIFCGLHTLYKETLREISNIKVYIDTEEKLKIKWKSERDVNKRSAKPEDINRVLEKRKPDFMQFIEPQKNNADIIIDYYEDNNNLKIKIIIIKSLYNLLKDNIIDFIYNVKEDDNQNEFILKDNIDYNEIKKITTKIGYNIVELNNDYNGILQLIFILLIWKY